MDLIKAFECFKLCAEGHQAKHANMAREIREANPPIGWDTYDQQTELKAKAHEMSAAAWGARSEAAGRNWLLMDHTSTDPDVMALHFDYTHAALVAAAQAAHRVEYVKPAADAANPDSLGRMGPQT